MKYIPKKIQKFYSRFNVERPNITTVNVEDIDIDVDVPVVDAFREIKKKNREKDPKRSPTSE